MSSRRFGPIRGLEGRIEVPPDKSISHRAAILAAMSDRSVAIGSYLDAADTRATLRAIRQLGAVVEVDEGERRDSLRVRVGGVGLDGTEARPGATSPIDAGNAGTLIRLIAGWLAGCPGGRWVLDGDDSLRRRPMERVAAPLRRMGATISTAPGGGPPVTIEGAPLEGCRHELEVASAQVKSSLLLAGLRAEGETTVVEPVASRDHTELMLEASGVELVREGTLTSVRPARRLALPDLDVPGDPSSAAFHLAAAAIVPGARVTLENVCLNPLRTGFVRVLERMGARAEIEVTGVRVGEPVGTIALESAELSGTEVEGDEVPALIDELPLVGLVACFARGRTTVRGAAELRHKESDRVETIVTGLSALGARAESREDGFAIAGGGQLEGGTIDASADHRIAMMGAIAGLASRGGVEVEGFEAAAVSYPGFADDLDSLTLR